MRQNLWAVQLQRRPRALQRCVLVCDFGGCRTYYAHRSFFKAQPLAQAAAAMAGDPNAFDLAMQNGIDCSDAQGNTALIAAAFAGNNALVLQLLGAKADVSKQNDTGCDAAWVAAAYGRADVLATLLASGGSALSCNKQVIPLPSSSQRQCM